MERIGIDPDRSGQSAPLPRMRREDDRTTHRATSGTGDGIEPIRVHDPGAFLQIDDALNESFDPFRRSQAASTDHGMGCSSRLDAGFDHARASAK